MAKKPTVPNNTTPLPGLSGKGVAPLTIPVLDKAITKYERAKDKRCQASPAEITAKRELQDLLHKNAENLPKNGDGHRFYRLDDIDYLLEERMVRRRSADGDEGGGEE